jgi:hypothetical protein
VKKRQPIPVNVVVIILWLRRSDGAARNKKGSLNLREPEAYSA